MDAHLALKAIVGGVAGLVVAGLTTQIPDIGWYPPTLFGLLGAAFLAVGIYILVVPRKQPPPGEGGE